MMKAIAIPPPSAEQIRELDELYQTTGDVRLRTRAQMILLAVEKGLSAPAIASIVREGEETVRRWMKRYMAEGIEGLQDEPRPSAAPKMTAAYEQQLLQTVRQRPRSLGQDFSMWTLQRLASYMAKQTGIRLSPECIRLHLQKAEVVLSRPQHKISSPDPEYEVKKRRSKLSVMT
jgi:transposase